MNYCYAIKKKEKYSFQFNKRNISLQKIGKLNVAFFLIIAFPVWLWTQYRELKQTANWVNLYSGSVNYNFYCWFVFILEPYL